MKTTKIICGITMAITCSLAPATLNAQNIYVVNENGTVGEYGLNGAGNTSFISDVGSAWGIASYGTNLFIPLLTNGTVAEYTTSGATMDRSLVSGLIGAVDVAISGTDLFLLAFPGIGEYTTSGITVNASLISGLTNFPGNIAISGTNLFVVNRTQDGILGTDTGTIGEYTTSGATVNASLISGLSFPGAIAISGTNLFVLVVGNVAQYTTSGALVNATFISSGTNGPAFGIAIQGTNLFVGFNNNQAADGEGSVGEYTTSGAQVNFTPLSGLNTPVALAVANGPPPPTPQLNIGGMGNRSVLFYPSWAAGYVVQSVTNLASTNWTPVTNALPVVCVMVTNNLPASFYRLAPAD
jgi:hypothetical protein